MADSCARHMAEDLIGEKKYEEAKNLLNEKIIVKDPTEIYTELMESQALSLKSKDFDEYIVILRTLGRDAEADAAVIKKKEGEAYSLLAQEKYEEALVLYTETGNQQYIDTCYNRLFLGCEDDEKALEYAEKMNETDKKLFANTINKKTYSVAVKYFEQIEYDTAVKWFGRIPDYNDSADYIQKADKIKSLGFLEGKWEYKYDFTPALIIDLKNNKVYEYCDMSLFPDLYATMIYDISADGVIDSQWDQERNRTELSAKEEALTVFMRDAYARNIEALYKADGVPMSYLYEYYKTTDIDVIIKESTTATPAEMAANMIKNMINFCDKTLVKSTVSVEGNAYAITELDRKYPCTIEKDGDKLTFKGEPNTYTFNAEGILALTRVK